ncbi:unnamed protein product, partial [Staurois parvus]
MTLGRNGLTSGAIKGLIMCCMLFYCGAGVCTAGNTTDRERETLLFRSACSRAVREV